MKIFDRKSKVNFVDDNNVFVGFDNNQCCCESFSCTIHEFPDVDSKEVDGIRTNDGCGEYPGFNFDTSYLKHIEYDLNDCDCGGCVAFRLTNGQTDIYLILSNRHNGYYCHGFEMKNDKQTFFEGSV
jgi:hypothetical protein